jgi:hypothetical protein
MSVDFYGGENAFGQLLFTPSTNGILWLLFRAWSKLPSEMSMDFYGGEKWKRFWDHI